MPASCCGVMWGADMAVKEMRLRIRAFYPQPPQKRQAKQSRAQAGGGPCTEVIADCLLDLQALVGAGCLLGQAQLQYAVRVLGRSGALVDFRAQVETACHLAEIALGTQDELAFLDFLLLLAFGADGDDGAVDIDMDVFLLYAGQLGMHEVAVVLRLDVDLDGGEFADIGRAS